jgi:nucleotide-binding universal stress UspA family protein
VSSILLGVDSRARSEDAVALARRLACAGSADVIVAADSPARGLHELAEHEAATVIVVGSTHTGQLGRVRPGSTAERLLCGSPCAVALAPHGYRLRSDEQISRIGAAYDGSSESRGALVAADAAAHAFEAALDVVSVVPVDVHSGVETAIGRNVDEVVETLPGAHGVVLHGRPVHELVNHSAELDLLFAGSRAYGPLHAVIAGGPSGPLMQHAHCPVVVLPRGADTAFADLFEGVRSAAAS